MKKYVVRFAHVAFDFISFYLLVFSFAMKLKDANRKKSKKMMPDLIMFQKNEFDFISFPLFGFTLVIKLRNFDFENY